jgi:hypothetical protein
MRPAGKARRLRILPIFEEGATPPGGMQREPNATRLRRRDTRSHAAPTDVLRYGAYLCLRVPRGARSRVATAEVSSLAARLGFENEFDSIDGHPSDAVAFLRGVDATPAEIQDDHLLHSDAVIHVASPTAQRISTFCVRPHQKPGVEIRARGPMWHGRRVATWLALFE